MDWRIKLLARRSWTGFGVRDRIVLKYGSLNTVSSTEFEVDFFGLKYK